MKIARELLWLWPCLLAVPLMAQPQVGAGTCDSSSLSGNYSLTLTGRQFTGVTPELFEGALEGVGTAAFDGLNKVTFTLTENTNATRGVSATLSGTYSIESNCVGVLTITSGDSATYALGVFNSGSNYIITGQDGTYSLIGSGNTMPKTSCSSPTLSGAYSFNGNGFGLQSTTIASAGYLSGILTFDGAGNVSSGTWNVTPGYQVSSPVSVTGTYTVNSNCTATAAVKDSAGNSYAFVFTITGANGSFIATFANAQIIFTGSGRPL